MTYKITPKYDGEVVFLPANDEEGTHSHMQTEHWCRPFIDHAVYEQAKRRIAELETTIRILQHEMEKK